MIKPMFPLNLSIMNLDERENDSLNSLSIAQALKACSKALQKSIDSSRSHLEALAPISRCWLQTLINEGIDN